MIKELEEMLNIKEHHYMIENFCVLINQYATFRQGWGKEINCPFLSKCNNRCSK